VLKVEHKVAKCSTMGIVTVFRMPVWKDTTATMLLRVATVGASFLLLILLLHFLINSNSFAFCKYEVSS
jgi:hypothetical protein